MSMTGMLKTYTKDDLKPKKEEKDKKHIDSYNPATSTRELNPYWKDGGTGIPQKPDDFRKSKPFIKPNEEDDYYSRSSSSRDRSKAFVQPDENDSYRTSSSKDRKKSFMKPTDDHDDYYSRSSSRSSSGRDKHRDDRKDSTRRNDSYSYKSNWKKSEHTEEKRLSVEEETINPDPKPIIEPKLDKRESKYLSDEKMNKLAAKIVKAEIMGDNKLVEELKAKLEDAREYRKQNPNAEEEDDGVMLMSMNAAGNSRPLSKGEKGDPKSKGGKRKTDTHASGERMKYFGNDDKYNLAQMVGTFLDLQFIANTKSVSISKLSLKG